MIDISALKFGNSIEGESSIDQETVKNLTIPKLQLIPPAVAINKDSSTEEGQQMPLTNAHILTTNRAYSETLKHLLPNNGTERSHSSF